jgi:hypothetical protein
VPVAPFAWTHEKTRVEFDGVALTVNGRHLPLDRIDRLSRNLSRSTAQGSWNRLDCGVSLVSDGEVTSIRFHGDASTEQWGPWRPLWDQIDALARDEIQPRLLERTIRQVEEGSPVELCPFRVKGRGRLVVTAESIQVRKLFSRPIAWTAITDVSGELLEITTDEPNGKQRTHRLGFGSAEWDIWQVAPLWQHFRAR